MAVGTPQAITTLSGFDTATTGSFTVPAGHTIIVLLGIQRASGGGAAPAPFTISGGGLSWTSLISEAYEPGDYLRGQAWAAISTGASMTITLTENTPPVSNFGAQILSVSGILPDFSNIDLVGNAAGDPAPSLPTPPLATSTLLAFAYMQGTDAPSVPTDHTSLNAFSPGASFRALTSYDAGSPAQSASWTTSNTNALGMLLELKAGASGYSFGAVIG